MSDGTPTIQIPRWIQLVGLPVLALIALLIVGKVFHVVFLFLVAGADRAAARPAGARPGTAADSARLLHCDRLPELCRRAGRRRASPSASIVIDQTQSAANRIDDYFTTEQRTAPADRLPSGTSTGSSIGWTRTTSSGSTIRKQGQDFAENIKGKDVEKYTTEAIDFAPRRGDLDLPAGLQPRARPRRLDLHAPRHAAGSSGGVDRRFPPRPGQPGLILQHGAGASRATCAGSSCCR